MKPAPPARSLAFWLLLVAAAFALLSGPGRAQQPPPPPEDYRYRVDVELVMVSASVTTPAGRPVTWLEREAFEVFEDGKRRPVKVFEKETELPLQLALLVDSSLSTAGRLKAEKAAMGRFIRRVLRPQDAAALYEFSGTLRALVDFSSDPRALERGLDKIKASAGTALYDTLIEAAQHLRERQGRRVLVLITDGNDTTSEKDFHAALRALQEAEATVFALVVRPIPGESGRSVRGEHVLITFADMTGGRVFFSERAAQLDRFFDQLSQLLRTQYLLGFQPAPPGWRPEFRTIAVHVTDGNYRVRHRTGYYTEPRR